MPRSIERCHELFDQLEVQRNDMLAGLAKWEPRLVNVRPAEESWSAVEVLDHLVKSEHGILNKTRQGLDSPHEFGTAERVAAKLKVAALERALRSSHRFPMPGGAKRSAPEGELSMLETVGRWAQARVELKRTVESLEVEDLSKGVFRHPVAGWMTITDVLGNLSAHLHHHTFQLARIAASLSN